MRFRWPLVVLAVLTAIILLLSAPAFAAPTQDEVLRSIHQNVSSTTDFSKVLPWLLGGAAVIIMLVIVSNRQKHVVTRSALNHPGKLTREITRGLHLKKIEVRQLKMLAEEQDLSSPLTLLLCPSVLAKAMRTRNPRIDRKLLAELSQRLQQQKPTE